MLILLTRCKFFISSAFVNDPIIMILIWHWRGDRDGSKRPGRGR